GAAATGGLAALVASVPVTAIGLAAAGVIVAGAVGVAGAMGVFSADDDDPDVVAVEPDIDDMTPTPPGDGPTTPADEPTDEPTSEPSTDPTNPANVPAVAEPDDDATPAPSTSPDPGATTPPTTPPPTSPPPTSPPPTDPPPPPVLVAQPPTMGASGFVAGQPAMLQVPVDNTGGAADEVVTQLVFPEGTAVTIEAADPPDGGGTSVRTASNGWSCSAVGSLATCTLPGLGAGDRSTLYANVTVADDGLDGTRLMTVGVRTWAPALGAAPATSPVQMQVSSPPTAFSVESIVPVTLAGSNDATPSAPATVTVPIRVTNTGTGAPASVRLAGIPGDVAVTPSDGWSCAWGLGYECTGPRVPRGQHADLVLTLADTTPLVDVDRTGFVTVTTQPGTGTTFSLRTAAAPARYALDVEQLTTAAGSTLDTHVTVTNTGRTTGRQVVVALDLPAGLTSSDAKWTRCAGDEGDLCRTIAALAPGASERAHIAFAAASGSYPLVVSVLDAEAEPTAPVTRDIAVGAPAPAVVGVSGPAELVLVPDVPATLSAAVSNAGGSTATGVVVQVDLPAGVTWVAGSGCAGRNGSNQALDCQVGTLAAGSSTTVTFRVVAQGQGAHGRDVTFVALWDAQGSGEDEVSPPFLTPVRVVADAPVVRVALESQTTFVQGVPRDLVATVTNAGTTTATGLTATLQLPAETFWERTAAGSDWTCTSSGGAGPTVTCTTPSLAPGATIELAGAIRANGTMQGRVVAVGLTWAGGAAPTAQTTVVIGSLPACAAPWEKGTFYRIGDRVSYESWNYTRLINFQAIYEPGRFAEFWRSEGACA
ncbi:hypothetical protein N867_01195, partial [Actinotalea fermentans ATCC 43279 = JCM 9966 = DSM 3133]